MKKIIVLTLTLAMLFSLSACSASSSRTSTVTVTTSQTDENGVTTTNTTTDEVGVTVGTDGISTTSNHSSDTQTTEEEPLTAEEIIALWYDTYTGGATGENENGDRFLLAYDDPEDIQQATLTIIGVDGSLYIREGYIQTEGEGEDEHLVLIDESRDVAVPFIFYDSEQGDFEMYFLADGDTAVMTVVDQETILGEMRDILEQSQAEPEVNTAPDKMNGSASAAAKSGAKSDNGYDAAKVRAEWESVFQDGAEGRNENGEYFLFAMDDSEKCNYVALMIMSADMKTLELYTTGYLDLAEEGYVIVDDHSDMTVPFTLTNTDDGFDMGFQDGDVAHMVFVSQEEILDDMLGIIDAVMR
ncbi:MAG: hypothetical protein IJQ02_01015 [Oscillospiraceae bacterium]|nr:hypothetical protein [Oscillospiraceae bacterium]